MSQPLNATPLVSIFMATYNHVNFIEEAIEGCITQKTNFPFELIICDDFSTDGTREKILDYAKKHDNIITSLQPHNTHGIRNMMCGLSLVRGKYMAICEGDDFWTSQDKLQKQIHFLENNPDFSVSCHKVKILYTDGSNLPNLPKYIYKDCHSEEDRISQGIFFADEVVDNYYMHTSSMVFRWKFRNGLPTRFRSRMLLDHFLLLLHAAEGKIKYFDEPMSVWRRHINGYSYAQLQDKGLFFQKEGDDWITCYREIDNYFHHRFHLQIRERILLALRALTDHCMKTGQTEQLRELYQKNWDILRKPVMENAPLLEALKILFPEEREFCPPWASADLTGQLFCRPGDKQSSSKNITLTESFDFSLIPENRDSVWNHWIAGQDWASFGNARSAICAFCAYYGISTVWVPSLCPPVLDRALQELQIMRKWYPVNRDMTSSPDFLDVAKPGDAVLTISWLGRPLDVALGKALEARPDLFWIEDRAQCLSCPPSKAKAVVYSPRNVLGVPDGGILVGDGAGNLQPQNPCDRNALREKLVTSFMPYEFADEEPTARRIMEEKCQLPGGAASRLTIDMLHRLPWKKLCAARKKNWRHLFDHLGEYALWKIANPSFAPSGFPLLLPAGFLASAVIAALAKAGIEGRRLWMSPFSQSECFGKELSGRLLILPCGHHLGEQDMHHVAKSIGALFHNKENEFSCSKRSNE